MHINVEVETRKARKGLPPQTREAGFEEANEVCMKSLLGWLRPGWLKIH